MALCGLPCEVYVMLIWSENSIEVSAIGKLMHQDLKFGVFILEEAQHLDNYFFFCS